MPGRKTFAPAAVVLACLLSAPPATPAKPLFGFYPSPPELTFQSVVDTFKAIARHADVVLIQRNIPWRDFATVPGARDADISDLTGMAELARQNGLGMIFVVDPLNGLDRRRFAGLPEGWKASFSNPDVRSAFTNYALRIVRQFHPRWLGLASEINTYQDTHPDDYPFFLSLYRDVYAKIKAAAPDTNVFVTFQWEELNNLFPELSGGAAKYHTRWDQVEAYEPQLDVWAISSYPFVAFSKAADVPPDYYRGLAGRTTKPIAIAEGGYTSRDIPPFQGTPQDQVTYLRAIQDQLGDRLGFWIHTLLSDFSLEAYAPSLRAQGLPQDVQTLGWFAAAGLRNADGSPKPALRVWDEIRGVPAR